jgi:uncharacterized protein YndB with AHSA1/START domain
MTTPTTLRSDRSDETQAPTAERTTETVSATIEIAAPPERVFDAITDPVELAAWFGTAGGYRTSDWSFDLTPGGAWSARTRDDAGREGTLGGELLTVDAPHVLELTWRASWDDRETTVRYDLVPVDIDGTLGTELTVTHTGVVACAGAAAGAEVALDAAWDVVVARLASHIALGARSLTVPGLERPSAWRRRVIHA